MKWLAPGFFALLLASCSSTGPGISSTVKSPAELLPARPEKGTLFSYYQAKDSSKWKSNWTAGLDFTGVSWNDNRCVTLISPSHVIMAAHFMRDSHTSVMFHDHLGQPQERFIVAYNVLSSIGDVAVGKLNMPLPKDIKSYQFANASDISVGTPVIVTDQTLTASIHQVAAVSGGMIAFKFDESIDPIYRRNLVVGDSSHPSFILKNGELLLVETHTTGGPGAGPFYGDPNIQATIRKAVAEMGN